jgi:hypothetical protein
VYSLRVRNLPFIATTVGCETPPKGAAMLTFLLKLFGVIILRSIVLGMASCGLMVWYYAQLPERVPTRIDRGDASAATSPMKGAVERAAQ